MAAKHNDMVAAFRFMVIVMMIDARVVCSM